MSELMGSFVRGSRWSEHLALGKLRMGWAEVVGASVASRSAPSALQRGVLTVRAESGAWASELTLLASALRDRCDRFLGGGVVREVRVCAGAVEAEA